MTDVVVHLVRHGEVANPGGILYGRRPGFGLSAAGRSMALAAGRELAGRDVALIRSSPLLRATETAEVIADCLGLVVTVDERLIESWNHFEGLRPGVELVRNPLRWPLLRNPFRPSWGEPYRDVADRMLAAVHDAAAAAPGQEAVLVSHQLPIWVTRLSVEQRPLWHRPDRRQCALASITSIRFVDGRVSSLAYAEPAGGIGRRDAPSGA